MAETSLSKIVGLIMENPDLVERIREIAEQSGEPTEEKSEETDASPSENEPRDEKIISHAYEESPKKHTSRRADLIRAVKPYLRPERQRAIETVLTVFELIDATRGGER